MIKKLLHIFFACCMLLINLGCTAPNVRLLKAYVTGNESNTKNYKYEKVGHEDMVLLIKGKIIDESKLKENSESIGNAAYKMWGITETVNISIPIEWESNQTQVIPKQMPSSWIGWPGNYSAECLAQYGMSCYILTKEDRLILSFTYEAIPLGWIPFYLALSPLTLGYTIPSTLRGIVQPRIFSFDMKKPIAYLQLEDDVAYDGSTELIRIKHTITPSVLYLSCKSGKCMVVDENKQIVNKLVWKQEFFYNTKRLKQLRNEEIELEKQRKREEAREKRERDQRLARQDEVCSVLYDTLYVRGGQYTLDPINKRNILRRWVEYECSYWMSEQLY